jgi:hypothetical protein
VPLLFALTMFVSATLLFLVQPMIGKMVLPLLGGTPAVWNTCMVFYQALLLAGYYYAHKTTSSFEVKRQTSLHGIVMLVALGVLGVGATLSFNNSPIPIVKSLSPQGDDYPFFGVIVLLTVAIGLPFFVVSTSAPLLQKWFVETGHPSAKDPYFLYAASNFGSLLALVAYPAVVEPNLRLIHQAWVWAIGYALLVGLVFACAKAARREKPAVESRPVMRAPARPQAAVVDEPEPSGLRKLRWLALAFVPSSLMLGVTTFISTDMASIPLLWIIPLSLYLITFIIVFANVPKEVHLSATLLMPVMVLLLVFLMTSKVQAKFGLAVLLHLVTFFIVALVCHGELAHDRPSPKHLTGFYLIMSFGGMLGGLFNALVAPIVFTFTTEYPATLVMACFLLPAILRDKDAKSSQWTFIFDVVGPAAIFFLCCLAQTNRVEIGNYVYENGRYGLAAFVVFAIVAGPAIAFLGNDLRSRLALAILLATCLTFYAVAGPVARYFKGATTLAEALRWLATAAPVVAYGLYWNRFGPKEAFSRHLAAGILGLIGCFGAMLLGAKLVADEFLGVIAFKENIQANTVTQIVIYGVPAMLCYFFVERPSRFGAAVAALWLSTFVTEYRQLLKMDARYRPYYDRSFFGRLKIERMTEWDQVSADAFPDEFDRRDYRESEEEYKDGTVWIYTLKNGDIPAYKKVVLRGESGSQTSYYIFREYVQLVHGTTVHGLQEVNKERFDIARALLPLGGPTVWNSAAATLGGGGESLQYPGRDPLTYYHRTGPVGSMFNAWEALNRQRQRRNTAVACIGLGTGSLSSYGMPGQTMTFFEIDTHVRRLVETPTFFTYVDSAKRQGVNLELAMGDARISLERLDRKYGFMLIDAFSSDAIPAHLLTKEAVELYFQRLEEDGLLTVHISNRYLDLEPIVERICRELKLPARLMHGSHDSKTGKYAATWIAIAKSYEALGTIEDDYQAVVREVSESFLQQEIDRRVKDREQVLGRNFNDAERHEYALVAMTVEERQEFHVRMKPEVERYILMHPKRGDDFKDRWINLRANDKVGLWTDDFSPIIPILRGEWRFWAKDE